MKLAPEWHIGRDNELKVNPYEFRQLKRRVHLTDRTLHVEAPPGLEACDVRTAHAYAMMALPNAAIGRCGKIRVKGARWQYEFNTKDLNNKIRKRWGNRTGMAQNPLEQQQAGAWFDTTRQIWQVPAGFNGARETTKFPTLGT